MQDVPLAFTCPYCTHERTSFVASLVRAFGPGWVVVKMRCDGADCRRVWHARMALVGVARIHDDDPEIDEDGAVACVRAGGFLCPRCRRDNVQVPTDIGCISIAGRATTPTGLSLWCVCLDCQADYYAEYRLSEVVKNWSWHSPFRKGR